jgi:hypothetical protein
MRKNKRGWVKMIEVVIALLLITGVLLLLASRDFVKKESISMTVYEQEALILREIQLNNSLRQGILTLSPLPIEWNDFDSPDLTPVKEKIEKRTPTNLVCEAKICFMNQTCESPSSNKENIYSQSAAITSTNNLQDFRQLKLFCVVK